MTAETIRTLGDILPHHAARVPGSPALLHAEDGGRLQAVTYSELRDRARRVAGLLAARGAEPGAKAAVLMPNRPEWVPAYYGVFRLGGVAVPLDHSLLAEQPERIAFALEHSGAEFALCLRKDAERLRGLAGAELRCVPVEEALESGLSDRCPPRPDVEPEDLAQILYTSGTTGPKKGVALTHRNLVFDVRMSCRRFGVFETDVLPALLPYHHAYPLTTTVLLPLLAGARMVIGDIRRRDSRRLIRISRPTVLVGVPRVFEALLDGIGAQARRRGRLAELERARRLSGLIKRWTGLNPGKVLCRRLHLELFGGTQLRFCVSGGARVSPETLRRFFRLGIPVIQGWGMSELSPVGAVQDFVPWRFWFTRRYEHKVGSIGRPLEGTTIALRPPATEELTLDAPERGEMVADGPHVMRGYYGDPELTRARITSDGLRSGDIARRDPDGDLYIVGRVKHVIVLPSGKKVFPEEDLEGALRRCPAVDQFAVRPVADGAGEKIGIIIRPDVEELRDRDVTTRAELYAAVKADIDAALRGRPHYLRQYDFCLTPWDEEAGEFEELVTTAMGDPSPLRNPWRPETAWSNNRDREEPVPWHS
ncbi:MAG: AMP-binding protein [Planctomycetota bacterium]